MLKQKKYENLPIIIVTSLSEKEDMQKGLELGIYDYIIKPVDRTLVFLKVRNAMRYYENTIEIEKLNKDITRKNFELEALFEIRTKELENMTNSLIVALENANLYNDENTGKHIKRVAMFSELIAKELGLSKEFVARIKMYAPIHDIGKVGIPDEILKKPGRYTPEEFEIMKLLSTILMNLINRMSIIISFLNIVLLVNWLKN